MPGPDAFLLVSFGGPERPEDVVPFLENVTRGRGVPAERLAEVAEHYHRFGGVSPINRQCRELLAALEADFRAGGIDLPLYWGNRNWTPLLTDTIRRMAGDGVRHAVAFVTSPYSSASSCRQYLDDIARARARVGPGAPVVDRLRHFFNHPGFLEPMAGNVAAALDTLPAADRAGARLVFTAHSIPESMARASGPSGGAYVAQLTEAARLVAGLTGREDRFDLVFQSRSGPPRVPWLEPDVGDHLAALAADGVGAAVLVPIGFISDHLEVVYDLDVEAAGIAARLGMRLARAATVGTDPRFVAMISELVRERARPDQGVAPRVLGALPPSHDVCPAGCCLPAGQPPPT